MSKIYQLLKYLLCGDKYIELISSNRKNMFKQLLNIKEKQDEFMKYDLFLAQNWNVDNDELCI